MNATEIDVRAGLRVGAPQHLDLIATFHPDGTVQLSYSARNDAAELQLLARLAQHIAQYLEPGSHGPLVDLAVVTPPAPGATVLACRCGVVLDSADMCRPAGRRGGPRSGPSIEPIVCADCAASW